MTRIYILSLPTRPPLTAAHLQLEDTQLFPESLVHAWIWLAVINPKGPKVCGLLFKQTHSTVDTADELVLKLIVCIPATDNRRERATKSCQEEGIKTHEAVSGAALIAHVPFWFLKYNFARSGYDDIVEDMQQKHSSILRVAASCMCLKYMSGGRAPSL